MSAAGIDVARLAYVAESVNRHAILGLTHSRCIVRSDSADEARLEQVDFPATVHLAFHELELVIRPSVCPFDQGDVIAERTAASSFLTPLQKDATKLSDARSIHAVMPETALVRII